MLWIYWYNNKKRWEGWGWHDGNVTAASNKTHNLALKRFFSGGEKKIMKKKNRLKAKKKGRVR